MEVIFRLLSELRLVLVAIAGICAAAFMFTGLSSLRDMRRAVFRLERSAITGRVISSWLKAGLCVLAIGVILSIPNAPATTAARPSDNPLSATPTVTAESNLPQQVPTADLSQAQAVMTQEPISQALATQAAAISSTEGITVSDAFLSGTLVAPAATLTPTVLVIPTAPPLPSATPASLATQAPLPTLPPATSAAAAAAGATAATQPVATVPAINTPEPLPTEPPAATEAPAEPAMIANCPNPDAQISNPQAGESVSGSYVIRGTAGFNQGKYKIEILRPNIDGWAFLWEGFNSVKGGMLMPNFNSRLFPPGVYTLRLMLVDVAGQETGILCTVPIRIS